jgi:aryl-alcohol dehydrogenase-like predicted oxidoreductase
MRYTTLGRTGLRVSSVGLGCGGPSRLGQSYGRSQEDSRALITRAVELGITLFDTAESYGTEAVLGEALREARASDVVVSTKKSVFDWNRQVMCTTDDMREGLEASLRRLGRERIEVYHLHGLEVAHVDYALNEIVPVLERARQDGKIGHLAVSEAFMGDTSHRTLEQVLPKDVFDVMMVGFNLLNPSARTKVLPLTRERNVGTLIMFAVRRALTNPTRLCEVIETLLSSGDLAPSSIDPRAPLGFLGDVRDAAYRFCSHEPGADVVLTGTGRIDHLEENVRSLLAPPLEKQLLERLERLFGRVSSVSGH